MKLYRSTKDIRWFAFGPGVGWVVFPAEVDGWQKRQSSRGIDPIDMREVPLRMGFNTGIPGAPMSAGLFFIPKRKTNLRPLAAMRRDFDRKATMETLLVLEDESSLMKLMRHMLKQYNLIEATSAEEALRRFNENGRRVDLLIADVTLPTSSGIQVALLLRSEIPKLPVLLTSGYQVSAWTGRDYADLQRLGSTSVALLAKPFRARELSTAVQELLGTPRGVTAISA